MDAIGDVFGERGAHVLAPANVHDALPDTLLRRVSSTAADWRPRPSTPCPEQLPYFAELDAAQRASVQLVVQSAVVNFAEWIQDPRATSISVAAFQVVPQDLA